MSYIKLKIINRNGLRNMYHIFVLNFLWIACSLPIITIGASTTALYYCMLKINHGEDGEIVQKFFKSFRQNLKQGCIFTAIFTFSGLFLWADFWACQMIEGTLRIIIIAILALLMIIWGILISYTFPLLAQFDNNVTTIFNNAVWLSTLHMQKTIIIFVINAIPVVLFFLMPYVFIFCVPLLMTFGVALVAFFNSKLLMNVFDEYIIRTT